MMLKQKLVLLMVVLGLMCSLSVLAQSSVSAVDVEITCPDGSKKTVDSTVAAEGCADSKPSEDTEPAGPAPVKEKCTGKMCCGNVNTSIIGGAICNGVDDSGKLESSPIYKLLLLVLNIMTAGVGIVAVGGIVYGAILYSSSAGSPEQTKRAISIITNVVIGLLAYALMYVLLNFLIPGGIFS